MNYLHGHDIIGQQRGTTWHYFGTDGLGSNRFMMASSSTISQSTLYSPYGVPMTTTGAVATNLGFTGEHTDPSGLQYLRARYYDPRTAAFLSRDPALGAYPTLSGSWNGYSYAHGNPVMYTDPSGEFPFLFAAAVLFGGTTIGGVSYAAWDVSVNQGFGLGGHNQFNLATINWDRTASAFRTGANTGMAVSSFVTGTRAGLAATKMGAGQAARYLATQNALDFSLGVAADITVNGDSLGEAALWNAAGFIGGEIAGAGFELAGRSAGRAIRGARGTVGNVADAVDVPLLMPGIRVRELNPGDYYVDLAKIVRRTILQGLSGKNLGFARVNDGQTTRLLVAISGGLKARSAVRYRSLLQQAGFEVVDVAPQNSRRFSMIYLDGRYTNVDTESQLLEYMAENILQSGRSYKIDLYTERFPCEGCGGFLSPQVKLPDGTIRASDRRYGTFGTIGDFATHAARQNINLEMNLYFGR